MWMVNKTCSEMRSKQLTEGSKEEILKNNSIEPGHGKGRENRKRGGRVKD